MGWRYDSSRGYWRQTHQTKQQVKREQKHYVGKYRVYERILGNNAISCFHKYYGYNNYWRCYYRSDMREGFYPTDTIAMLVDNIVKTRNQILQKFPQFMKGEYHQHITEFELKKFKYNSLALKYIAIGLDKFECQRVDEIYWNYEKPSRTGGMYFVNRPWQDELEANYQLKKLARVNRMLKEKYGWKKWGYKQLATLYKETIPKVVAEVREILRHFPTVKDTEDRDQRNLNVYIQNLCEESGIYETEPGEDEVERRNSPIEHDDSDVTYKPTIAEIAPDLVKEKRAKLTIEDLKKEKEHAEWIAKKEAEDAEKMREFLEKKYEKKK